MILYGCKQSFMMVSCNLWAIYDSLWLLSCSMLFIDSGLKGYTMTNTMNGPIHDNDNDNDIYIYTIILYTVYIYIITIYIYSI